MQDQPIGEVAAVDHRNENAVLGLLLEENHPIWTLAEITRDLGVGVRGEDAVSRLHSMGMVHRLGEFVFATRSAAHAHWLR
jgi:hypothetical protein